MAVADYWRWEPADAIQTMLLPYVARLMGMIYGPVSTRSC